MCGGDAQFDLKLRSPFRAYGVRLSAWVHSIATAHQGFLSMGHKIRGSHVRIEYKKVDRPRIFTGVCRFLETRGGRAGDSIGRG